MKELVLTTEEVESLEGIINVELNDLATLRKSIKKGQEQDLKEIDEEIEILNSIMKKLS